MLKPFNLNFILTKKQYSVKKLTISLIIQLKIILDVKINMQCHVCLYFISGKDLEDEDTFCDKLEDVVTSVKRNGVAIKGKVT